MNFQYEFIVIKLVKSIMLIYIDFIDKNEGVDKTGKSTPSRRAIATPHGQNTTNR